MSINPHEADQSILLSALVDSVAYIPPETNENSMMVHTRDIINDLTNYPENVYLSSYYYAANHEVLHENYLVDIVLSWHCNGGKTIEIPSVGKIEPEDDPVILMMKLKDKYIP